MITSHRNLASDGFLPSAGAGIDSIAGGTPTDRHFHTSTSPPLPSSFQSLHLHHNHHNHHSGSHHGGFPPTINRSTTQRTITPAPRASSARHHTSPPIHQPTDLPISNAIALYRSISAESAPPTVQGSGAQNNSNNLVQRLAQQNAAIREAWEAERTYLEANRRRAEEVYQEERVIMDEVREGWESEKATMLRENEVLRERVHRLEGENHALLKAMATQAHTHPTHTHISGVVSPQASLRGDSSLDTSTNASAASGPSALTGYPFPAQTLDRAAPAYHGHGGLAGNNYNGGRGSSRTSPTGQPESSPFIPLDPRMQTQAPVARDFLSPTDEPDATAVPVPVIDVQEVDPKLEGIPLKATAVQKATFGAGDSHTPSPVVSPPVTQIHVHENQEQQQEKNDQVQPQARPEGKRASSKEHTIQVLQAEASRRLTMHAGHTPNHSLSRFPTMSIAASSTGAAADDETSGQASTAPYSAPYSAPYAPTEPEELEMTLVLPPADVDEVAKQAVLPDDDHQEEGDPETLLVAEDDVALRGPLMIRNIPAQDEIFWDQVNKKLEPISQGMDALPTVMRVSVGDEEAAGPLPVVVGGDASQDTSVLVHAPAPVNNEKEGKRVEGEIALKFRTTTNFGAPFGVA